MFPDPALQPLVRSLFLPSNTPASDQCCGAPGVTALLCESAPKFTLTLLTFSSSSFICLFWASILSSNSLILCNVQRRKILKNQNIWETKWEKIFQDFHRCTWWANPTEQLSQRLGGALGCLPHQLLGPWLKHACLSFSDTASPSLLFAPTKERAPPLPSLGHTPTSGSFRSQVTVLEPKQTVRAWFMVLPRRCRSSTRIGLKGRGASRGRTLLAGLTAQLESLVFIVVHRVGQMDACVHARPGCLARTLDEPGL